MNRAKLNPLYIARNRHRVLPYLRYRFPRLAAGFFVGRRFSCAMCGAGLRRWATFFTNESQTPSGGLCPFCRSLPRTRQLWWLLEHGDDLKAGRRVLHVAPEAPLLHKLRSTMGCSVKTLDLGRDDVDLKASLDDIPCDDASFDVILCSHVLEHVEDDGAAMREMARVLDPRGTAYVMVPLNGGGTTDEDPSVTDPQERERRFGQSDHVRSYGSDIAARLTKAGFDVSAEAMPETLQLDEETARRLGLDEVDTLFRCRLT